MAVVADVIRIAEAEVGYVEQGGANNNSGNLTKYGKWYGIDAQPWCAMFISWVFFMAGMPLPASTSKGFAYTPSGAEWFKKRNRWSTLPRVGAVVFFSMGGQRIDHVGLVVKVNGDGSIITIEGNTSSGNAGSQRDGGGVYRRLRKSHIVGYGLPEYVVNNPPPRPTPPTTSPKDDDMYLVVNVNDDNNPTWYWVTPNSWTEISSPAELSQLQEDFPTKDVSSFGWAMMTRDLAHKPR